MAYCYKHSSEYDFLGSCPHCSLEKELREQSRIHEKIAYDQTRAAEAATEAQISAMEEIARQQEERQNEALAQQERIAEQTIIEQQRIAHETILAQQYGLANSWRLEAAAKIDRAFEMIKAGMYEESLSLAREAIGENGRGDVTNISGHLAASIVLLSLDRADEAEKYFLSQIKLLGTSDYCDNVTVHETILQTLPTSESLIRKFSTITLQNAENWRLSHDFLKLITQFVDRNLIDAARILARLFVTKLEENYVPLEHFAVIHQLSNANLIDEARLAINGLIRKAPEILKNDQEMINLLRVLIFLVFKDFIPEAKSLTEIFLQYQNTLSIQMLRQEIRHRSGEPFDGQLKNYLFSISSQKREALLSNMDSLGDAECISQPTLEFAKRLINTRYDYWKPLIEEETRVNALRAVDYRSQLPIGLMIGAFLSSVLCFPIGFVVNAVWGYKVLQRLSKLKYARAEAQELLEREAEKWATVLYRRPIFSPPSFTLTTAEIVEILALVISVSISVFMTLRY